MGEWESGRVCEFREFRELGELGEVGEFREFRELSGLHDARFGEDISNNISKPLGLNPPTHY